MLFLALLTHFSLSELNATLVLPQEELKKKNVQEIQFTKRVICTFGECFQYSSRLLSDIIWWHTN